MKGVHVHIDVYFYVHICIYKYLDIYIFIDRHTYRDTHRYRCRHRYRSVPCLFAMKECVASQTIVKRPDQTNGEHIKGALARASCGSCLVVLNNYSGSQKARTIQGEGFCRPGGFGPWSSAVDGLCCI